MSTVEELDDLILKTRLNAYNYKCNNDKINSILELKKLHNLQLKRQGKLFSHQLL